MRICARSARTMALPVMVSSSALRTYTISCHAYSLSAFVPITIRKRSLVFVHLW